MRIRIKTNKRVKVTSANRQEFIDLLIEYGELIRLGDGFLEDMGGHIIRDDADLVDAYIYSFFKNLSDSEYSQLIEELDL